MRKRKWVDAYIESEDKYIVRNQADKGNWLKNKNKDKLYLEIGMGMGDFITESARRNPNIMYVGFEKVMMCVAKASQKAEELALDNFNVILDTADNIENYFDKEVDRIYLHFSDPWPKKGYWKRRLTYHTYLQKYEHILKEDADIIFKTDNKDLFEFTIIEIQNEGWKLLDFSVDYHRHENDDPKTGYEAKFVELGQPIYFARFKK